MGTIGLGTIGLGAIPALAAFCRFLWIKPFNDINSVEFYITIFGCICIFSAKPTGQWSIEDN